MSRQQDELRQIFLAEALDSYEELNRLFTALEKDHADKESVRQIFRITHTLKANAAGMGFNDIAQLSHVLEDLFSLLKEGKLALTQKIFNDLFSANDKLGDLLSGIKENRKVPYKGMLAKLRVILRNAQPSEPEQKTPESQQKKEKKEEKAEEVGKSTTPKTEPEPAGKEEIVEEAEEVAEEKDDKNTPHHPPISFSDLVQVPVKKLDALLNLVGELAIEKDRLIANYTHGQSSNEYAALNRITSDLQYSVMGVRLVQVTVLFQKFHRIIRDVAKIENKKVNLVLEGTDIEIDRNVLQIISDSMVHLVRNAVSHGIERPEVRKKKGKDEAGVIKLIAANDKDHVIITVEDDGKGIDPVIIRRKVAEKGLATDELLSQLTDEAVIRYIFEAGFSSADSVTAVSGRGVGMDVVRKVTEAIGGKVSVSSVVGKGSSIKLSLPSSMAVKSALLFLLNDAEFCIPLSFTEAVISVLGKQIHQAGSGLVTTHLDKTIPLVFLQDLFSMKNILELREEFAQQRSFHARKADEKHHIIVVSVDQKMIGFVVDRLLQQKEIIEKPLSPPVEKVNFISGATILGNGNVCLVLDVPDIADFLFNPVKVSSLPAAV